MNYHHDVLDLRGIYSSNMADPEPIELQLKKADSPLSAGLAILKPFLENNPWIWLLGWVLAFLFAVNKAVETLPKVPAAAKTAAGWVAVVIFRLSVFVGAFAILFFVLACLAGMIVALRFPLYWATFVLSFGRVRKLNIQLPGWVKPAAESLFFGAICLGAAVAAFRLTIRAPRDEATVFALIGTLILLPLSWVYLRASFPAVDARFGLAFDRWKELKQSLGASIPLDQATFALLPLAIVYSTFVLWHVFRPWYVSDRLNAVFGGLSALSFAVLGHRWIARPFASRFTTWKENTSLRRFGTFLVLAASGGVWILVSQTQFSSFPSETRMFVWLQIDSNSALIPKTWSSLDREPALGLAARPFAPQPIHALIKPDPIAPDALIADTLELGPDLENLADATTPFRWVAVAWRIDHSLRSSEFLSSQAFLYSSDMQFQMRPSEVVALAEKAPMCGAISWPAPDDACDKLHVCNADLSEKSMPEIQGRTKADLLAMALQMLKLAEAKPISVLGNAQLRAHNPSEWQSYDELISYNRASEGPVLLVAQQDGKRRIMALLLGGTGRTVCSIHP
jgi:hypothetical protein